VNFSLRQRGYPYSVYLRWQIVGSVTLTFAAALFWFLWGSLIFSAVLVGVGAASLLLAIWNVRYFPHTASVGPEELAIGMETHTKHYRWDNVLSLRDTTVRRVASPRGLRVLGLRIVGIDLDTRLAEVRMYGSNGRLVFEPEDVSGFVSAASRYLTDAESETVS